MDWSKVGEAIGEALPLLGGVLLGPAGAAGGRIIASTLGVDSHPDKVLRAIETNPDAIVKLKTIEAEHERELRRMALEAETNRLAEINATIRAEVASDDNYVRRMRPTFGYVICATILIEAAGIGYVLFVNPGYADIVANLIEAFVVPQSVALGVLGVYVKKRSDEKAMGAGYEPAGVLGALLGGRRGK